MRELMGLALLWAAWTCWGGSWEQEPDGRTPLLPGLGSLQGLERGWQRVGKEAGMRKGP